MVTICTGDSVYIFVRHSYLRCDTIARLYRPPYSFEWDYSGLHDQDQLHFQFGYKIFKPDGKIIISKPLPNQWVIDRTTKKSRKTYHCRQIVKPDTVIIDGKLDEWRGVYRGKAGDHATFALLWSNTMLYFAAEVKDIDIGYNDIIELHLDPYRTRSSFSDQTHRSVRFGFHGGCYCIVSFDQNGRYIQCDSISSLLKEGMSWRISSDGKGYYIEAGLPWYALSDLNFPKLRFGLDVTFRYGTSPAKFYAWANSREFNRYNPSEWGTVVLHQAMLHIKIALMIGVFIVAIASVFIAVVVIRHFFLSETLERKEAGGGSEALQAIEKSIKDHICDRELTIEKVAQYAGMTADALSRTLLEELDCTFQRFLCFKRISAAKELLWDFNLSIDEIAHRCGFSSTSEMNMLFKEYLNTDPVSFREKNKETALGEDDISPSAAKDNRH